LPFETTQAVQACEEIIGQERAQEAIRLGLNIHSIGYNIFVTGLTGTGRFTTIKCILEELNIQGKIPNDFVTSITSKTRICLICSAFLQGRGMPSKGDGELDRNSEKENPPDV